VPASSISRKQRRTSRKARANDTLPIVCGVCQGTGLVGIVLACELFPAVYRTFAGVVINLFWAAAWMFLAVLAYLIRDWRHLQLAITLPGVLTLPLIWYAYPHLRTLLGQLSPPSLRSELMRTRYGRKGKGGHDVMCLGPH